MNPGQVIGSRFDGVYDKGHTFRTVREIEKREESKCRDTIKEVREVQDRFEINGELTGEVDFIMSSET